MGELVVQFHGKSDEYASPGEIDGILQVIILEISQDLFDLVDIPVFQIQARQVFLPPDLPCFAQYGAKQLLFAFEMVIESSLRHVTGIDDVADGSALESLERKQPQRFEDYFLFRAFFSGFSIHTVRPVGFPL